MLVGRCRGRLTMPSWSTDCSRLQHRSGSDTRCGTGGRTGRRAERAWARTVLRHSGGRPGAGAGSGFGRFGFDRGARGYGAPRRRNRHGPDRGDRLRAEVAAMIVAGSGLRVMLAEGGRARRVRGARRGGSARRLACRTRSHRRLRSGRRTRRWIRSALLLRMHGVCKMMSCALSRS